ncbi:MAG TPA: hypothetical protein VER96_27630 [Polyangiaceae bacterium]|nr:hypothetical protein [Polyangiaceae bacterium]
MNSRAAPVTLMFAKSLALLVASFAVACSGSDQPGASPVAQGDSRLFVPENVGVSQHIGNNSSFNVTAFTLSPGSDGLDFYAAVKYAGTVVACNSSFTVELHDKDDEIVATSISGLMARRFYRFAASAGPLAGDVAGCVNPGDVTEVAIKGLSLDPPNAEVRSVIYQTTSWANLDLEAIAGVSLMSVSAVTQADGVAYKGSLVNGLSTTLSNPTVAVYPVNSVGRPLGVAYGGVTLELAPGASWDFETSTVGDPGVGFEAYPMGGP